MIADRGFENWAFEKNPQVAARRVRKNGISLFGNQLIAGLRL